MTGNVYSGFQQFDAVDATGREAAYIEYLERMEQFPEVVDRRRRSYELLELQRGDRVADVGCGLGTATRELAELGFHAVGLDNSEAMIAEARRRSKSKQIDFKCAPAESLPFEDGSLAGYRAERLYQHLSDPWVALAEARRVLVPGGRVVLDDPDWDALLFDGEPKDVTRAILRAFSDSIVNGWIGRSFRRLLTSVEFVEVVVQPDTSIITDPQRGRGLARAAANAAVEAGAVDPTVASRWLEDQWARCDAGAFFASVTSFLAVARQPH